MIKSLADNWQRFVFAVVGLVCLYYSFQFLRAGDVTSTSAVFAISFLSFLYSNLSRFKRFKGLGFEAELWEDKQKEAAELIDRLKDVVSVYTTEVVMNAVTRGRLSDGEIWADAWRLFDDLVEKHNALGQKIDFSALKKDMDDYFLFDLYHYSHKGIQHAFLKAKEQASEMVRKEFGPIISDMEGYAKRQQQANEIDYQIKDSFRGRATRNLAEEMLTLVQISQAKLDVDFGIDVSLPEQEMQRLRTIANLYRNRPVKITDELIGWAGPAKS